MSSINAIRAALESALNAIAPPIDTVWQNVTYSPIAFRPYQTAKLIFATPGNAVYGGEFREMGLLRILLRYPPDVGAADALDRAQLIRDAFKRGNSFTYNGVTVVIDKTPAIGGALDGDPDRYVIPVSVSWYADIFN